ncbi:uncharacterized protein LOC128033961 [Gossypium raimondii]|uniref:uncharacterized protein LOC128033961 n=1 Tax=Gossypium raimondii TaxID=29730 RepID=UPI002279F8CC|nr:uncharacterized protein LOC128033961 [Gossypium raimondii]
MKIGKKGELSLRFIDLYDVVERISPVAYQLTLPPELERIHDVFQVSMLRNYRADPSHVVTVDEIEVQPGPTYDDELVEIITREEKVLQNKKIPLVKVLWQNHRTNEATWETEEVMKCQ